MNAQAFRAATDRVFALAAIVIATGVLGSTASGRERALTVFTHSGSVAGDELVGAVLVRPTSLPGVVARALAARQSGARALLLDGFADDLTSSDMVISPAIRGAGGRITRPAMRFPAPWLEVGTARARQRSDAWLMGYVRAGGVAPDLVMIRCRASMSAVIYLPRVTPSGWNTVASDRRFPALAATIGVPDLRRGIYASAIARTAWDRHFERAISNCLKSAIAAPFAKAFPGATVCLEERFAAPEGLATVRAREGAVGIPQQVTFSLASRPVADFAALGCIMRDLEGVRRAGVAIPTVYAPGSAQWLPASGIEPLPASLQAELVRHLAAAGIRALWSVPAGWASADGQIVAAAIRDANAQLGGGTPIPAQVSPSFDSARLLLTGSVRNGTVSWRLSMADDVQSVLAIFADGGLVRIDRTPGTHGAWISHPESRPLVALQTEQAMATSPESQFVVLSDDVPAVQGNGLKVAPYMIIYQGVDPQSYSSARMDSTRVISAIAQEFAAGRGSSWGVLDFEDPFNDIMDHGPSDPRFAPAMDSLVKTIRAVKSAYPSVRWTYYNFPRLPYWHSNRDWAAIGPQEREIIQGGIASRYAPLMDELDWFMPSIYDRYERARFDGGMLPLITLSESSFREASVTFLHRYAAQPGKARRPVIPMVSPWFIEGGRATQYRAIPSEELVGDQVRPAVNAGADGIALWCATEWLSTLATRDGEDLPEYARIEQARVRSQFAIDFLGGVIDPSFDWTESANTVTIRRHLAQVVTGAVAAVKGVLEDRQLAESGARPVPVGSLARQ
jgi:hypothetical protein